MVSRLLGLLLLLFTPSRGFLSPCSPLKQPWKESRGIGDTLHLRGGDSGKVSTQLDASMALLQETLVSGGSLRALGGLYAISSSVLVPLTIYRQAYSFSVGYGLSVAAQALLIQKSFGGGFGPDQLMSSAPSMLAMVVSVYGVRLAAYIFLREQTVESKRKQFKDMDKTPALKRIPFALSVAAFYTLMVSPLLFAFRQSTPLGSLMSKCQLFFTGVAAVGALLETVADQHKYETKRKSNDEERFVGPTTWSYRLVRHPNYLGEIMHWLGVFGAGAVTFRKSILAWVTGSLGLYGIFSIMLTASKRLDKKQQEKYGGQEAFDEWAGQVSSSLVPLIK